MTSLRRTAGKLSSGLSGLTCSTCLGGVYPNKALMNRSLKLCDLTDCLSN